jgi:WD40 repeat protein
VKVWDPLAPGGKLKYTLSRHSGMVYALAFSPDGQYFVSGSTDKTVFVWKASDGSLVRSYSAPSGVYDLSWNATGDKIACACANSAVSVLELRM